MGYVDWDHYGPELKSAFRNGPVRGNLFPAKKGLEILSFSFLGKKRRVFGADCFSRAVSSDSERT